MKTAGFEEQEHTADWALRVWAPDLPGLLEQAARGMYALMELSVEPAPRTRLNITVRDGDAETLLVSFLSELLYLSEQRGLAFDRFDIQMNAGGLDAAVEGSPFSAQRKEIKAVTYHNLAIHTTERGYEVTIVFDV